MSAKRAKLFYLQNLSAGFVGNSPLFWRKGDNGYTSVIDEAELFTASQCRAIIRGTTGSHSWKMWPEKLVNDASYRTVDIQTLRKRSIKQPGPHVASNSQ